jgi:hypothetical protein
VSPLWRDELTFSAKQQAPWELLQDACELLLEVHNRQEMIPTAKDFERHAFAGK